MVRQSAAAAKAKAGTPSTKAANHQPAEDVERDVINAVEAAEMLFIHPVTVRLQAKAGVIPGLKIGNRLRFRRKRIKEWLDAA